MSALQPQSGSADFSLPSSGSGRGSAPAKKKSALLPEKLRPAVFTLGGLAAVMVIIQLVQSLSTWNLIGSFGLIPRRVSGLDGILFAPLLHAGWGHLLSNLVPLLIFGLLLFVGGVRQFWVVTILVWLVSGVGLWLVGPSNTVTVGASGLVFGWLAYLVARGLFTRNIGQIVIGVVLLLIWGTLFLGIFTTAVQDLLGNSGISWQGHLLGAIGGVLAAFLVAKADGPRRAAA